MERTVARPFTLRGRSLLCSLDSWKPQNSTISWKPQNSTIYYFKKIFTLERTWDCSEWRDVDSWLCRGHEYVFRSLNPQLSTISVTSPVVTVDFGYVGDHSVSTTTTQGNLLLLLIFLFIQSTKYCSQVKSGWRRRYPQLCTRRKVWFFFCKSILFYNNFLCGPIMDCCILV